MLFIDNEMYKIFSYVIAPIKGLNIKGYVLMNAEYQKEVNRLRNVEFENVVFLMKPKRETVHKAYTWKRMLENEKSFECNY